MAVDNGHASIAPEWGVATDEICIIECQGCYLDKNLQEVGVSQIFTKRTSGTRRALLVTFFPSF